METGANRFEDARSKIEMDAEGFVTINGGWVGQLKELNKWNLKLNITLNSLFYCLWSTPQKIMRNQMLG